MDKNAIKLSKKQKKLIFRGVAFCAKRNYSYLCTRYYELVAYSNHL